MHKKSRFQETIVGGERYLSFPGGRVGKVSGSGRERTIVLSQQQQPKEILYRFRFGHDGWSPVLDRAEGYNPEELGKLYPNPLEPVSVDLKLLEDKCPRGIDDLVDGQ
jgi:hypothetical protein